MGIFLPHGGAYHFDDEIKNKGVFMTSRIPIVAGNWKMYKIRSEAADLVNGILPAVSKNNYCEVVVCPPFTALQTVANIVKGTKLGLGAQNCHFEDSGAFTGEVSPLMLKDIGCKYVIIGHSERRTKFGETDESINKKLKALYKHQLLPILCCGETLEERESKRLYEVVERQIRGGLADIPSEKMPTTVIAYEPVWAIGTGRTATPEQAQDMHAFIRKILADMFDKSTADNIRIQYGGSVNAGNVKQLMAQPDIDGALVGGASLEPEKFIPLIQFKD